MTTGLPQNQQDLRWPSEADETGPGRPVDNDAPRGRKRADRNREERARQEQARIRAEAEFSANHPSGPLPIGLARQPEPRRFGRKGRDEDGFGDSASGGDADYDWYKYLGEAGPAQESATGSGRRGRPNSGPADASSADAGPRAAGSRTAGPGAAGTRDFEPHDFGDRDTASGDSLPRWGGRRDALSSPPVPGDARRGASDSPAAGWDESSSRAGERGAGRLLPRRHAAPAAPDATTSALAGPSAEPVVDGRRTGRPTEPGDAQRRSRWRHSSRDAAEAPGPAREPESPADAWLGGRQDAASDGFRAHQRPPLADRPRGDDRPATRRHAAPSAGERRQQAEQWPTGSWSTAETTTSWRSAQSGPQQRPDSATGDWFASPDNGSPDSGQFARGAATGARPLADRDSVPGNARPGQADSASSARVSATPADPEAPASKRHLFRRSADASAASPAGPAPSQQDPDAPGPGQSRRAHGSHRLRSPNARPEGDTRPGPASRAGRAISGPETDRGRPTTQTSRWAADGADLAGRAAAGRAAADGVSSDRRGAAGLNADHPTGPGATWSRGGPQAGYGRTRTDESGPHQSGPYPSGPYRARPAEAGPRRPGAEQSGPFRVPTAGETGPGRSTDLRSRASAAPAGRLLHRDDSQPGLPRRTAGASGLAIGEVTGPQPAIGEITGGQAAIGEVVAAKAAAGMVVAPAAGRGTAVAPKSKPAKSKKGKAKAATAAPPAPAGGAVSTRTQPAIAGAAPAPARRAAKSKDQPAKTGRKRHPILIALGVGVVVAGGGGAAVAVPRLLHPSGPAHTVTTPQRLLSYVQQPALAKGLGAEALRNEILKKGHGEASHVVDAVYEDSAGPGTSSGPLIVLFIGGNLSGSASSFISSFTGMLSGSFVTSPGSLGGQAACVPGVSGHPAECAWADNDTFGLIASPTLSAKALGAQLRQIRPLVEHDSK